MAAVHGYFSSRLPPRHQNHGQKSLTFAKSFVSKPMNYSFESHRHLAGRIVCAAEGEKVGFFGRLGRVIKEKAKSDVERLFSGFSKTRDNLAVVDELLTYWNLSDTDQVLDELEEALLVSDFGPKTAIKIVENLRKEILAGNLKSGQEIKVALKKKVIDLLKQKVQNTELQLGLKKPAVVLVVGVNGGGKTTSIGKLAYKLQNEGKKVLMAAGDTFRAAARDQLEVWAKRTNSEIVIIKGENVKPTVVLSQAVCKAMEESFDVVLCDTSGRLHTDYTLMEELIECKRAIKKLLPGAPNEVLLVLDGTTGLNMLPQAREFNEVIGVTGFILTKLDGSARGGCVVTSYGGTILNFDCGDRDLQIHLSWIQKSKVKAALTNIVLNIFDKFFEEISE